MHIVEICPLCGTELLYDSVITYVGYRYCPHCDKIVDTDVFTKEATEADDDE